MSDININGIPNMGFAGAGGGYFGGNAALGLPAMGAAGDFGASKFSQPLYNNIFGNFGQQTDYYSALGAAYGRQTGGFGAAGSNPGWQTPAPAADPWSGGATPYQSYGQPLSSNDWWSAYYGGQQAPMGSTFDQGGTSSFPMNQPPVPPAPNFNSTFSPYGIYSANQGANQDAYNLMRSLQGVGVQPPQYQMPQSPTPSEAELGGGGGRSQTWQEALTGSWGAGASPFPYGGGAEQAAILRAAGNSGTDFGSRFGAAPAFDMNSFANRFGALGQLGQNAGTPSQYTYQPYTNTQGQTFQPNLPQGFAPYFDVDHPQGALPLNWNSQAGGA